MADEVRHNDADSRYELERDGEIRLAGRLIGAVL